MVPNPLNENNSPMIINRRHQSKVVALNVKHRSIVRDDACILIAAPYIGRRGPICGLRLVEPGINSGFDGFVIPAVFEGLCELKERTARNHSHVLCLRYSPHYTLCPKWAQSNEFIALKPLCLSRDFPKREAMVKINPGWPHLRFGVVLPSAPLVTKIPTEVAR